MSRASGNIIIVSKNNIEIIGPCFVECVNSRAFRENTKGSLERFLRYCKVSEIDISYPYELL